MPRKTPAETLAARLVTLLRRYTAEEAATRRTEILQEIGERLVDLREHYLTADGQPDWSGKSHAYKMAISDIYARAALGERKTAIQTAVRYHVNNALRRRLSAEELQDLGLMQVSARERSVEHRADKAAMLAVLRPDGAQERAPVEPLQAAASAHLLLKRVPRRSVKALSENRTASLAATLDEISAEVARIRDAAGRTPEAP